MRLDKYLTKKYPRLSRSYLQKLIKSGAILVNNKKVTPHYKLKPANKITENITPPAKIDLSPDKSIKLDIIYEDENYFVINKPAGLVVHPSESVKTHTLVNALLAHFPKIKNVGDKKPTCPEPGRRVNNLPRRSPAYCGAKAGQQSTINNYRPGIVHRLDKDVSGLMVVAKTQNAFDDLKKQFQNHEIKKEYTALVYGNVKKDSGEITIPIGRSSKGYKMSARSQPKETDKIAITRFKVIKRLTPEFIRGRKNTSSTQSSHQFIGGDYTLLKIQTLTGRTHQIRVHLHAIGHPIVGDPLYRPKRLTRQFTCLAERRIGGNKKIPSPNQQFPLFLHANLLAFNDLENNIKKFKLELPKELKNILNKLNEK